MESLYSISSEIVSESKELLHVVALYRDEYWRTSGVDPKICLSNLDTLIRKFVGTLRGTNPMIRPLRYKYKDTSGKMIFIANNIGLQTAIKLQTIWKRKLYSGYGETTPFLLDVEICDAETPQEASFYPMVTHEGFRCQKCGIEPIIGPFFVCLTRPKHYICSECETNEYYHYLKVGEIPPFIYAKMNFSSQVDRVEDILKQQSAAAGEDKINGVLDFNIHDMSVIGSLSNPSIFIDDIDSASSQDSKANSDNDSDIEESLMENKINLNKAGENAEELAEYSIDIENISLVIASTESNDKNLDVIEKENSNSIESKKYSEDEVSNNHVSVLSSNDSTEKNFDENIKSCEISLKKSNKSIEDEEILSDSEKSEAKTFDDINDCLDNKTNISIESCSEKDFKSSDTEKISLISKVENSESILFESKLNFANNNELEIDKNKSVESLASCTKSNESPMDSALLLFSSLRRLSEMKVSTEKMKEEIKIEIKLSSDEVLKISPGQRFSVILIVFNIGGNPLPPGTRLMRFSGENFSGPEEGLNVGPLPSNSKNEFVLDLVAPSDLGSFCASWSCYSTVSHCFIGDKVSFSIEVVDEVRSPSTVMQDSVESIFDWNIIEVDSEIENMEHSSSLLSTYASQEKYPSSHDDCNVSGNHDIEMKDDKTYLIEVLTHKTFKALRDIKGGLWPWKEDFRKTIEEKNKMYPEQMKQLTSMGFCCGMQGALALSEVDRRNGPGLDMNELVSILLTRNHLQVSADLGKHYDVIRIMCELGAIPDSKYGPHIDIVYFLVRKSFDLFEGNNFEVLNRILIELYKTAKDEDDEIAEAFHKASISFLNRWAEELRVLNEIGFNDSNGSIRSLLEKHIKVPGASGLEEVVQSIISGEN